MKSTHLILFVHEVLSQGCSSIVTRPEIRALSSDQLARYFNAVKALRNRNGTDNFMMGSQQHFSNVAVAHGVPAFFPWHREFLRRYEMALQEIDPAIVLPYWDWSQDAGAPEFSAVLGSGMTGGSGSSPDYCVRDGEFAGWQTSVPDNHCLRRQFNNGQGTGAFYSPDALESILRTSFKYDGFRQSIETSPHGIVHVGIGGSNGDLSYMYSSNDPIFYLHHGFVDLLWNEWQLRNPSLAFSYDGSMNGAGVTINDIMVPFNIPVSQVMDTTAPGYCYNYPRFSGSIPDTVFSRFQQERGALDLESFANALGTWSNDGSLAGLMNGISNRVSNRVSNRINTMRERFGTQRGRSNPFVPNPLPESFIRANNLNSTFARNQESLLGSIITALS